MIIKLEDLPEWGRKIAENYNKMMREYAKKESEDLFPKGTAEVTLADIKKALKLIEKESKPYKQYENEFGWIEVDKFGNPLKMGLKEDTMKMLKEFFRFQAQGDTYSVLDVEIKELYGVEIDN